MAVKSLSPFKFVRVVFYDINGKPVFGKMAFISGMQEISTQFEELQDSEMTV